MARRRLQAILATTVITVGLSSGPVLAQELSGLTATVEETVTSTSGQLASTTEEVVDTLTGAAAGEATADPQPTEQATTDQATTEQATTAASEDDALIDVGTGDGTLDVELDVDLAPSDEDGSPQLEVDGGITVGGEQVDVGGATDPIEEVVDPDPAPSPSGDTSSDQTVEPRRDGPGGFFAGGGVVAAGDRTRPATAGASGPTSSSGGQGFTSFGSGGGDRNFGLQRFGGGTMDLDRVADPEVAPPADAPREATAFDELRRTNRRGVARRGDDARDDRTCGGRDRGRRADRPRHG